MKNAQKISHVSQSKKECIFVLPSNAPQALPTPGEIITWKKKVMMQSSIYMLDA